MATLTTAGTSIDIPDEKAREIIEGMESLVPGGFMSLTVTDPDTEQKTYLRVPYEASLVVDFPAPRRSAYENEGVVFV